MSWPCVDGLWSREHVLWRLSDAACDTAKDAVLGLSQGVVGEDPRNSARLLPQEVRHKRKPKLHLRVEP